MTELLKHCNHCDLDLPRSQFYSQKAQKDGLTAYCKAYYAEQYVLHRDRQRKSASEGHAKRRYGMSRAEYEALIAKGCAVCGTKARGRIVLDHCHASGNVREPLCNGCNVALGSAADDPAILRSLAEYLERHASA